MSAESSKQYLFTQIDGLLETGRLTQQQCEALKIYALWAIKEAVVEAAQEVSNLCETCHKSPRAPQETECFGCLADAQEAREERLATDRDWEMAGRLQRTGDC